MRQDLVTLVPSTLQEASRWSDTEPFWGGAMMKFGGGTCSTGFAVRLSDGKYRMVTAGHCGAEGTLFYTYSGGVYVGVTTSRATYPYYDMELIGKSPTAKNYGGYVYMGGSSGYGARVSGASNPAVGAYYCSSGARTYETCGHKVISTSATWCVSGTCRHGMFAYQGGTMMGGGDSGGPFVLKNADGTVGARGILIGYSGSTMYGTMWSTIKSYWSLSIVTS